MAKYRHIVFDVDGDTDRYERLHIIFILQEMLMTVKGERYEIEDLKFVLANTSVKNMRLSRGGRKKKSRAQSKCGWQMKRRTSI